MKRNRPMSLMAFAAIFSIVAACVSCDRHKPTNTTTTGTTIMACDETFQNIMQQEIDVFEYQYPQASILSYFIPEYSCIDSIVKSPNVRIAVTTHELTPEQTQFLRDSRRPPRTTRIAVDAIAVIANPDNPIKRITVDDLGKILAGEITEWRWVEPGNNSGDIKVVFDYEGSSTVSYMRDSVMHGRDFGSNVYAQNSNAAVFNYVKNSRGALGIIGVSWLSSDLSKAELTTAEIAQNIEESDTSHVELTTDVNIVGIARDELSPGVKPYQAYIYDGSYPLFRSIYMICTGHTGSLAGGFYTFVTGFAGQKLIMSTGVLPGAISPRIVTVE